MLFVPGDRPGRIINAFTLAVDAVVIDLEDAHMEAQASGSGVALMPDGTFIDRPVVVRARQILASEEAENVQ